MGHVNEADLDWSERDRRGTQFRRKQLGSAADNDRIGCSLYLLPPGGKSWPYHYHTANEEALYVLDGAGRLRLDDEERRLRQGTYVSLPVGASGGHRVVNDTDEPLRYLMVSTMTEPDITIYPDHDTLGIFAGSPPGGDGERDLEGYYDIDATVPYPDEER
ncbi:MAG: cupin domain-containing protein [Halobacteriaceae archaeon]